MNKLIIFDFDGVLVDTEYTTFSYYQKILKPKGIILPDSDFKYKKGRKSIDFFHDVLRDKFDAELVRNLIDTKRQMFIDDIKTYLTPIIGAFELLETCNRDGLDMAIGSQNERELIEKAVDVYNIRKYFKTILSLQDIKNKKPDPELFLLAANKAGGFPETSIVIEDSPHGIEAAVRGGFKSIGITTSSSREELTSKGADLVIDKISEINTTILRNL